MFIDSEKRKERLKICKSCEMNIIGVCKECGCVISLKTTLENENCPLNKWSASESESKESQNTMNENK